LGRLGPIAEEPSSADTGRRDRHRGSGGGQRRPWSWSSTQPRRWAFQSDRQRGHFKTNTCLSLSTDHDLNRLKKLMPRSNGPVSSATLPLTFSRVTGPTFNDLMRKVVDFFWEPSASV